MYTTGSSGAPTPFVSTAYDFLNILALNRNMLRLRGVTERDSILNLFPLTRYPHGAFVRVLHAAASCNIPVVSAMPGRADARRPELTNDDEAVVAIAVRAQPTILWGVPSYIRRLIGRAEEIGARLPSVRLVFVTGEGFGEEARSDLIERLKRVGAPAPWVSVSYGATEMQGGLVECAHGSGYHNPAPDQFLFEAVDPETKQPVPDGSEGLILLTHLDRRGTVMLRYALGDVARLTRAPCPHCGARTERIISLPRRVDGLVKIKGMLVNPQALVDAVRGEPALLDFQAVVDKENPDDPLSMDRLRLRIVTAADAGDGLDAALARRVQRAVGVTPIVERTCAGRSAARWPRLEGQADPRSAEIVTPRVVAAHCPCRAARHARRRSAPAARSCKRMRPSSSTQARSETASAFLTFCSTIRIALPLSASRRTTANT